MPSDSYDQGDPVGNGFKNFYATIYSPPYLFKPDGSPRGEQDRPRILGVSHTEVTYGQGFVVTYVLADGSNGIQSVVLIRPGSVTHSVNFEQRLVRCRFEGGGGSYTVTAPWKAQIAPPGWYMLFVVDDTDVPSVATWVRLIGSPDVPYICW